MLKFKKVYIDSNSSYKVSGTSSEFTIDLPETPAWHVSKDRCGRSHVGYGEGTNYQSATDYVPAKHGPQHTKMNSIQQLHSYETRAMDHGPRGTPRHLQVHGPPVMRLRQANRHKVRPRSASHYWKSLAVPRFSILHTS